MVVFNFFTSCKTSDFDQEEGGDIIIILSSKYTKGILDFVTAPPLHPPKKSSLTNEKLP